MRSERSRIFHIVETAHWLVADTAGSYEQSTRGLSLEQVGFIHCSAWEQVVPTAQLFYADVDQPLVVLEIDVEALSAADVEVRWEHASPGDSLSPLFPHIYGALPTSCVCRVLAATFDAKGAFVIDPSL